ncbi:MAG: hypothetical protein P9M03_06520, partial [Candidatus Theseobacter exili]|nr:hypothetical protein [Candidatus Theseobacter exili]
SEDVPVLEGLTVLPVRVFSAQSDINIDHVMAVARYISDVGREALIDGADPRADEMLKELLKELYEEGEISAEALESVSFAEILQDPSKLLIPPITSTQAMDIDSYIRTARAVEAMA